MSVNSAGGEAAVAPSVIMQSVGKKMQPMELLADNWDGKDAKGYIALLVKNKLISPLQRPEMMTYLLDKAFAKPREPRDVPKPNSEQAEITNRQTRAMEGGHGHLPVPITPEMANYEQMALKTASMAIKLENIDPVQIKEILLNHMEVPNMPYQVAALAPHQMLNIDKTSIAMMRPDAKEMIKRMMQSTPNNYSYNSTTDMHTILPFQFQFNTRSHVTEGTTYVPKMDIKVVVSPGKHAQKGMAWLKAVMVYTVTLISGSAKTLTTPELYGMLRKMFGLLGPAYQDLLSKTTPSKTEEQPVQVVFQHLLPMKDNGQLKRKYNIDQYVKAYSMLAGDLTMAKAEQFFEAYAHERISTGETRTDTPLDANASARMKFKMMDKCCQPHRHTVLVFGSGQPTSSLVALVRDRYKDASIEFVDPIIEKNYNMTADKQTVYFSNKRVESYEAVHDHYCHIISDVGKFEASRYFFSNDYRYTNYMAAVLMETFKGKYTKLSVKLGFAEPMPRIKAWKVWNFKPYNPEFYAEIDNNAPRDATSIVMDLFYAKVQFAMKRSAAMRKGIRLIPTAPELPIIHPNDGNMHMLSMRPVHRIAPTYSHGMGIYKLVHKVKPAASMAEPDLTKEARRVAASMEAADGEETALTILRTSSLPVAERIKVAMVYSGATLSKVPARVADALTAKTAVAETSRKRRVMKQQEEYLTDSAKKNAFTGPDYRLREQDNVLRKLSKRKKYPVGDYFEFGAEDTLEGNEVISVWDPQTTASTIPALMDM